MTDSIEFHPELKDYIEQLSDDISTVPKNRLDLLEQAAKFISAELTENRTPNLVFICTHNSRRSHFGQIWAKVLADWFNVPLNSYSGGTEATRIHPNAMAALERAGLKITVPGNQQNAENPKVEVGYSQDADPIICYSKRFEDVTQNLDHFAAIMTCSDADEACPLIPGADARIPLTYEDPKVSDGTPEEAKTYDKRCRQIATEIYALFDLI